MSRPAPFSLRLTAEERAAIEAKAGGRPLAGYIKSVVLSDDAKKYRKQRALPNEDKLLLAQILARLGQSQTAPNLARIADGLANGTLVIDEALETELLQALADVAWMRVTLMRALGTTTTGEASQ